MLFLRAVPPRYHIYNLIHLLTGVRCDNAIYNRDIIKTPEGKQAINSKWGFGPNKPRRIDALQRVKEYQQVKEIDYKETYAPVN